MTEDLSVFFSDFGVDCVLPNTSTVKVIFEVPDEEILGSMIVDSTVKITGQVSEIGGLANGDTVTIDGTDYLVRKVLKIDDGQICEAYLKEA